MADARAAPNRIQNTVFNARAVAKLNLR